MPLVVLFCTIVELGAEVNRVAVLLFLEEESLLGPDSLARTLDEDLHDHVLHIDETYMLKSRAGNEGELLLIKLRQR